MEPYKNLNRNSAIVAFKLQAGSIIVQFNDGVMYLYSTASAGAINIGKMHELALQGHGLNSFINRYVGKSYERKWR